MAGGNNCKYVDALAARKLNNYSLKQKLFRLLWDYTRLLFFLSPRPLHGFRCALLRAFGAKIGRNCTIANNAKIFLPWNLEMGEDCSIGDWAPHL